MAAAAHNPSFARKVGVPTSVAREFDRADEERSPQQDGKRLAKANRLLKGRGL